ncbi:MAG TPA: dihydrodipicolinate synthase family protein [Feifaniaceae bacterium]|nr:dihydrodipicolinate synthase family protein [Feifaniaceae bacterium]
MNKKTLAPGVWPTMITLFDNNNKLDFKANAALTDWLIRKGAHGIFAVCQSSEMFFLSQQEKTDLARCVLEAAQGRVPVIASGHTSIKIGDQIEELGRISETGVDAVVMVTNRLARKEEDKDAFLENMEHILSALPDVNFGLYECPYPFLRLLSLEELKLIADTGRILFLKDVSCNAAIQQERAAAVRGTSLGLYNANAETLFNSFPHGYVGYNGIMGNYHIDIYRWYYENYRQHPELAAEVQEWICWAGNVHKGSYPVSAKYHLNLEGIPCSLRTRAKDPSVLTEDLKAEIRALHAEETKLRRRLGIVPA